MSAFRKALLWTTVPIVALSLINGIGRIALVAGELVIITPLAAIACIVAALVTATVFAIIGKKQLAAGVLAGAGIGIVALGVSCFASSFVRML